MPNKKIDSQGHIEGRVNHIKMIKRQMLGRAGQIPVVTNKITWAATAMKTRTPRGCCLWESHQGRSHVGGGT
jgi:hypothetical protein